MRALWMTILAFAVALSALVAAPQAAMAAIGDTVLVGGTGGAYDRDQCPPGYFLAGMHYQGNFDTNQVRAICKQFVNGNATDSVVELHWWGRPAEATYGFGAEGTNPSCPNNTAVQGITVFYSPRVGLVHEFQFRCRNPNNHDYIDATRSNVRRGAATTSGTADCGGGAMAVGIVVRHGALIDALGLICETQDAPPVKPIKTTGKPRTAPATPPAATPPPAAQGPDQPPLPIDNALFAFPGGTATAKIGAPDGTAFSASCGNGNALVGWGYNAHSLLTAIVPVCQRVVEGDLLGTHGQPARSALGAEAADAKSGPAIFCPDHEAVRGLSVYLASDLRVHHIRGTCYALVSGQGAPTLVRPTLTSGGTAPANRSVNCNSGPRPYAIGLTGTFSNNRGGAITSLGLICADAETPAPAAADPAPAPAAAADDPPQRIDRAALRTVEVKLDAEVYAAAGGQGQSIGDLNAGTVGVTLVEACRSNWCHVHWPDGEGWVYSGPDYNSLGR